VPVFALLTVIAVLSIPAKAIDHNRARDLEPEPGATVSPTGVAGYGILFKSRPLVIFGLCAMLFHFANAPLLPLVGQKLAAAYPEEATAMMSTCIVAAQLVMLPFALLVGRTADSWGRKPLFLVGFGILPIRAVLYTLSDNSFWLIGVQLLDGVGAGIFGALTPLVVADIMRGTGRYNLALALQLRFLRSSESIGHHDSEIVDDGYFDRDDAGALGVIAAGCQSADGAIVHPGAGGGFCGLIPGRTTRRRAAQDRLDAGGSGGRSRSLAPAGHSGSRMVGR